VHGTFVVSHQHNGAGITVDCCEHLSTRRRIKIVCGLVQQEHIGARTDQHRQSQPGLLAARQHARRLVDFVTSEQKRSQKLPDVGFAKVRRGGLHVCQHRATYIQGLVLLGVVADAQAMTR